MIYILLLFFLIVLLVGSYNYYTESQAAMKQASDELGAVGYPSAASKKIDQLTGGKK